MKYLAQKVNLQLIFPQVIYMSISRSTICYLVLADIHQLLKDRDF
jgi:hypothetical protein